MELKFVNASYFKQLFQNFGPKLQYSKNVIFMTSHFSTLFSGKYTSIPRFQGDGVLIDGNRQEHHYCQIACITGVVF